MPKIGLIPLALAWIPLSGPWSVALAGGPATDSAKRTGLLLKTDAAWPRYTLFAPTNSTTTYLIDMDGNVAHSWPSRFVPGEAVYLLDDGSLLRCSREPNNWHFGSGGAGGRVERIAPDGSVLWEFILADKTHCLHHDIHPLPNGHILMIAWERKSNEEAVAAGRDAAELDGQELWPDYVIEVEPQGASGGRIVWEWHVWDHLVQDIRRENSNYGVVAEHPELIDLNFRPELPSETTPEIERLRALGYVGLAPPERADGLDMRADWCHTNAIAYNAELDQIALSVCNFNEIWIIDHSTTTKEAAGHTGGRYGKGGDLLYRWGNPRAYGAGDGRDQRLFAQHDVRWIPRDYPGAGRLTVFNNGRGRPERARSSVVEIAPSIEASGQYSFESGRAFGPVAPVWEYAAEGESDFFSGRLSSAQRLPNGNTLVCAGEEGRFFEVTPNRQKVWEYINPYRQLARARSPVSQPAGGGQHPLPGGGPAQSTRPHSRSGAPLGSVFRATRVSNDHPGVQRLLKR